MVAMGSFAVAALAPAAVEFGDGLRVAAAREALAAVLAEGRSLAIGSGGATVTLADGPWRTWVTTPDSTFPALYFADFGVEVSLGTRSDDLPITSRVFSFNALGLGSVTSQTVTFARGGSSAALVVSSYGRASRR